MIELPIDWRNFVQQLEYPQIVNGLMKGYREMANLNREISHDFSCCEEDADFHLTQYRQRLQNFH